MKHFLQSTALFLACALVAQAQDAVKGEIQAFAASTGSIPTIDKATNSLSFLRFPAGRAFLVNGGDATQKSLNFVSGNRGLLGIRPNEDVYRFIKQQTDAYGLDNVVLEQTYKGVPVYDGVLKFQYNKNKQITSVNGNIISGIKVNTVPTLAQHEAESLAMQYLKKDKLEEPAVAPKVFKSTLLIFQKGLAQGYNGPKSLVYEVEVRNDADIREFFYIDAHNGALVEQFTGMHNIHRTLYETSVSAPNKKWDEGNAFPGTLDQWQQSEVQSAGQIYNLMKNAFNRISYNGADATMVTVNNDPDINCPNANWNGTTANYCTGIASDDVVAHEWGHAYTEYTSGLIYKWQPGALNEAYSDIWGETVDQLNNYLDAGESAAPRTACASSQRWQMGEQTTGGALRDMWDPTCKGSPGKVSDPQYWCASTDNGGVHINSGVLNHAYALLVDGGTYNGQTITGIGLTKAAHIFWRAQSVYMTKTTDFAAQADILESALSDLVGMPLQGLSTSTTPAGVSASVITLADAAELSKVLTAVQLRMENSCGFAPILAPVTALCSGADPNLALFSENFESGLGAFTASHQTSSGSWAARNWVQADAPGGRAGKVAFGVDYPGGDCNASVQTGLISLQSPQINIPAGTAGNLNMVFDHYVATEDTWDGGNIKYAINGGAWTLIPATAFTANSYNNFLNSAAAGNDNPLQGQPAFTGANDGSLTGSWGQSQINLTALGLLAGDNIKFRWDLGTDGCGGTDGWYIDDFRVYSCAVTPAVHFVMETESVNEGEASMGTGCLKYVDKMIAVQIDKAPSQPVTVIFNTPTGTAKQGITADYTISPATVTLQAGSLIQYVTVRVYNDAYVEGSETVNLSYTLTTNGGDGYAAAEFQNCELTIVDDDLEPGNYTDELSKAGFNTSKNGWIVRNGGNSSSTWDIANYSNAALDAAGRPFFFVNSNATSSAIIMDEIIESPAINTLGKKNMVLSFLQDFYPKAGGYAEQALVEIWDGSVWHTILTQTEATGRKGNIVGGPADQQTLTIPDAYANVKMKIRFRYKAQFDAWWGVDNVLLTSSNSTTIQTVVDAGNGAQQYLGPNETAVFYDPTTKDLMVKIKNLSAHDYGCTTVEVDRGGIDDMLWFGNYNITKKTFLVTPTNNNPAGNYQITLYYKASELPNFHEPVVKSMGKSTGGIGAGNSATSSTAVMEVQSAFDTDYAFTSTFTNGFSGFGLTDAAPGPLPVTLTKFDGKNTKEGNMLNWETTSEVNSAYFIVESTPNGKNFAEIGRIAGNGNSKALNPYHFLDAYPQNGANYYRLKQVDNDGTYAYSKIISIDALNAKALKFGPNPVESWLTIEIPNPEVKLVDVKVINLLGREMIVKESVKINQGKLSINMERLPAGVYQVIATGEQARYHISVVKP